MSFPTIHASWLGAMSYASPAPDLSPNSARVNHVHAPRQSHGARPTLRRERAPGAEPGAASKATPGRRARCFSGAEASPARRAPNRTEGSAGGPDPEAGAVLFDDDPSDLLVEASAESGSGVFSAISGLREPTDDPVGPVLRDDRDPADAPVRKAAPVGRQRMVAPNEVQDRGFEPCPQRRALGPRFEQGAVVFVAPLFIAVAVLLEGDRQVIGVTGIGTHDLPPLARRPHSAGTANERRARSQEGTSPPGPLATL